MPYRTFSTRKLHGNVDKARFIKYDRLVGIEIEATGGDYRQAYDLVDTKCGVTEDGSVTFPSIEIQTPPASADKLEELIRNATQGLRTAGFGVDRTCGLHIHIDGEGFYGNPENTNKLIATYYALEPVIHRMLPNTRRRNTFCRPMTAKLDDKLFKKVAGRPKQKDKYIIEKKWYAQRTDTGVGGIGTMDSTMVVCLG
jgi:hypothetical protein